MSYIKSLKIRGFKSFANETILNFENNFNTIVGANGSGKSNIFDALCFVLGRISSKELRTQKLGNLVFNGGAGLKPMSKAKVSIVLSNENGELIKDEKTKEVEISRVVTKKGSSDYFINDTKTTRTNIVELLLKTHINPDGYNIILQGDISKIVNMSPIERRELIEEISNIKDYEDKRKKGLVKLEKVNIDLEQADILINEKTKYIKDLKSEKENAIKFNEVKNNLERTNLLFLDKKILKNIELTKKKKEELLKNEELIKNQDDTFKKFQKELDDKNLEVDKIEKQIEKDSREDYINLSKNISQIESKIKQNEIKISENEKQLNEIKSRSSELSININQNNSKIKDFEKELTILKKDKVDLDKKLWVLNDKTKISKSDNNNSDILELEKNEKLLTEFFEKKENKIMIRQDNIIQIEKLNTKIESLNETIDKSKISQNENKEKFLELEKKRNSLKKIILDISNKLNEENLISVKIKTYFDEVKKLESEILNLEIKSKTKNELINQNRAVSKIMELSKQNKDIIGTLMDLISCEKKYQTSIETICKKNLFSIVVSNDKSAIDCVNFLKDNKVGRATFFPLNKINFNLNLDDSVLNKKGVINYAKNLISYDKKYENIINLIFQDTLIIEKIEFAKDIGINKYKMVSLDGDVSTKSGVISGGFNFKNQNFGVLKSSQDIDNLNKLKENLFQKEEALEILKQDKERFEKEIYDLRVLRMEDEAHILKLEKLLEIENLDIDGVNNNLKNLLSDKKLIENNLKILDKQIKELDDEIDKIKKIKEKISLKVFNKSSNENLVEIENEKESVRQKITDINLKIKSLEIQINSVLVEENKKIEKLKEENKKVLVRLEEENKNLNLENKENSSFLKDKKSKEKELSKEFEELLDRKENLKSKIKSIMDKHQSSFEKLTKLKEKSSNINFQIDEFNKLNEFIQKDKDDFLFEIKTKIEQNLYSQEDYNNLIEENSKLLKKEIDLKELQNKVNNLKINLNSFGSINLKAVEVYDKLKDEFDTLMEKRQSLTEEKKGIINFIEEIDKVKKVRFLETFENIKKHFVEIFSQISKKGKVELTIQNEKDLFNSGIDIRVRLSKTNYLDIKSLSGGEKTITAISFIFAIQEFNPASFYILDEVDAALDIMNCEMLGKLILKYSKKAQYICVSHSEHFIQSSDIIYGVAMNSSKISDALSLDLRSVSDYTEKEV